MKSRCMIVVVLAVCLCPALSWAGETDGISLTVRPETISAAPSNLPYQGSVSVEPSQHVNQTLTVTQTGRLIGIEIAPVETSTIPGDTMILDLFDQSAHTFLGSVSLPASAFQPGGAPGNLPDGASTGSGFFDMSALNILVTAGATLSFTLRPGYGPGTCDLTTHECIAGPGPFCFSDNECDRQMQVGLSGDQYPGGLAFVDGALNPLGDLAFKLIEQLASPPGTVTLSWTGGGSPYDIYRSDDPLTLVQQANFIATSAISSFVDLPPAGSIWFYEVRSEPELDQFNVTSNGSVPVSPSQHPGQTFTVGISGRLGGIEIAPLLDSAVAGDTMILDLFDGGGGLLTSVSIPASAFPPGTGNPAPLEMSAATGPGYFDLSGLDIPVTTGDGMSFTLRPGFGPGVCDLATHTCSEGRIGRTCLSNTACNKQMRIGVNVDTYSRGNATLNGVPDATEDLAFKVLVIP